MLNTLTSTELFRNSVEAKSTSYGSTELLFQSGSALNGKSSVPFDSAETELLYEAPEIIDFDASALEGRYVLKREIHGGGMSRVFLAESAKLGNLWIVKFVSNQNGALASEANILKLLNHVSLPKIIDIFQDDKGAYIVESFIEGISLNKVLESEEKINQAIVLEWAEQITQVLNYLHRMEPDPIYHFDLKPSNIMVTHDNKLVLIDFGISKKSGEEGRSVGVTYKYAAPEQLKHRIQDKYADMIESRFGGLPEERMCWDPDARTDIYSLGAIMFELATGEIPTTQNAGALKNEVSPELYEIIRKCMEVAPDDRYQSASALLFDLRRVKGSKIKMARTLFMRKAALALTCCTIVVSSGSMTGGYYIYGQENMATLDVKPEIVTVSVQQSSELNIEKKMPNGKIIALDSSQIIWAFSQDNIARVDGDRLSGMNPGESELSGQYRNKHISIDVKVVEPMNGMVDISQRYQTGHAIAVYAGKVEREHIDGTLGEAEFVSPESIAVSDDGTIYIADSGVLRRIRDGQVDSIDFKPDYLTPNIVRCYKNDVYVLTNEWKENGGVYYGIIKLTDNSAEGIYVADAKFTAVEDLTFSPGGLIYFIDRNAGVGGVFLKTLDPDDPENIQTLCELPKGMSSLTTDENGAVYLANPDTGVIQVWKDGNLSYFTGVENEKAFIDGTAPLFYMPQNIKYDNDSLYIWDFNTLRKLSVIGGAAEECITIAGEASPTFDLNITQRAQNAEDIILPNSRLMDFAVKGDSVLITDPKRGVVWLVE